MANNTANKNINYKDSDKAWHIINVYLMVVSSGVFLVGTVGNGLVIWFTTFRMKRTVSSVWFLSLAIADFILSLFQPVDVIYIALGHWPLGDFMCRLYSFVITLNLSTSVLQLSVISLDRCISIVFPFWSRAHRTMRLAFKVTLVVWILALAFSLPYFILGDTRYLDKKEVCYIDPNMDREELRYTGNVMRFIIFFVVPFIIIVFSYAVIYWRIQRQSTVTSSKPFRMIATVIVCFFICWFPFHVFSLMKQFSPYSLDNYFDAIDIGYEISVGLSYLNSCINPPLYVFFGQDFKEKCWPSVQSALRKAFNEDANWTDSDKNRTHSRFLPNNATSHV
ncbi:chemerin-like receptor 1 [Gastrophryne carolinensis]